MVKCVRANMTMTVALQVRTSRDACSRKIILCAHDPRAGDDNERCYELLCLIWTCFCCASMFQSFFDASIRDFEKVLQTVMSSLTKRKIKINLQRHRMHSQYSIWNSINTHNSVRILTSSLPFLFLFFLATYLHK